MRRASVTLLLCAIIGMIPLWGLIDSTFQERALSVDMIQKRADEIHYDQTKTEWVPKYRNDPTEDQADPLPSFGFLGSIFRYILLIAVVVFVVFILIMIFSPERPSTKLTTTAPLVTFEDDIDTLDLWVLKRDAVAVADYRSAVRYHFLMILQVLSDHEVIRWQKDKTNRQYIQECSKYSWLPSFQKAVYTFDLVWYGHDQIDKDYYTIVVADLDDCLAMITPKEHTT